MPGWEKSALIGLVCASGIQVCQASDFAQVSVSTAAPAGIITQWLASTTSQYLANVVTNPFAPRTYTIQLIGVNPAYNPPVKDKDLLNALVTVDSYSYVNGWADGESYEQFKQWNTTAQMGALCGNATNFMLIQASTKTFDRGTCQDTVAAVADQIFQLRVDTPTTVPGLFQ